MKRKLAWLTLPLVLCALLYGLKWRAEHPPVTKEDLEARSLLLQTSMTVTYNAPRSSGSWIIVRLSEQEKKALLDGFHGLAVAQRAVSKE
ncbi:MAG: hypothetical protein EOP09_17805 [Proteobacteria bacterium]|nr:MAG: hypothetical protein EOP09_17805 [Pseudomonadota bacterium]